MGPFELLELKPRRFGREPKWNAWAELHNGLVAAATPRDFGPGDRMRIGAARGVDLETAFLEERLAFYGLYLRHLIADDALDGEERARLAHVAATLGLDDAHLASVHEQAFGRVAVEAVTDALVLDALDADQDALLYKLQHALTPDAGLADAAYGVIAEAHLRPLVDRALADGVLAESEETRLDGAARAVVAPLPPDTARARLLGRACALLFGGTLPHLPYGYAPLTYYSGEVLHYVSDGGHAPIKGLYGPPPVPRPRLLRKPLPPGRVAVTSRRIAFFGDDGSRAAFALADLRGVQVVEDRVFLTFWSHEAYLVAPGAEGPVPLQRVLDLVPRPERAPNALARAARWQGPRPAHSDNARPPAPVTDWATDESGRFTVYARVSALDMEGLQEALTEADRMLLKQRRVSHLALEAHPAVQSLGRQHVVVTSRRVLVTRDDGRVVSLPHTDTTQPLLFADGVALRSREPAYDAVSNWFVSGLYSLDGFYDRLLPLWGLAEPAR